MTADPGRAAIRAQLDADAARDRAAADAAQADREARRAAVLARYGNASSALAPCLREVDLAHALWRIMAPGTPETGGPHLMGWRGSEDGPLPPDVRSKVAAAIRSPSTAEAAWEEHHHWRHRAEVHAVLDGPGLPLWVRARRAFLDVRLDTLFAMLPADPEAIAAWNRLAEGASARTKLAEPTAPPSPAADPLQPDPPSEPEPPAAAIAAAPLTEDSSALGRRPQEEVFPRSGENPPSEPSVRSPDTAADDQDGPDAEVAEPGQPKRTRAEKQAAVRALLSEPLTDREIARRVGVSPSTVASLRKAAA